jgi:ribosome recycling factor
VGLDFGDRGPDLPRTDAAPPAPRLLGPLRHKMCVRHFDHFATARRAPVRRRASEGSAPPADAMFARCRGAAPPLESRATGGYPQLSKVVTVGSAAMPLDDILLETEEQMDKAVDFLRQEYRSVRTGRATTGLVDTLRVEVESYGATMSMKELANLAVAEGNTVIIKPFDPTTLKDIQRAIEKSGLGINPQSDGKLIRLPVPPLSTERRNQLAGHVRSLAEQQKVAIRNLRRDANKAMDVEKKAKTMTEDDVESGQEQVQKLTDDYTKKVDDLLALKTREIMEV